MKPEKLNFIRLGARYSTFRKLGIGNKAALLNHAVKSSLPVPNGILLPDGAWQRMIADGIIALNGNNVVVNSADEMLERFALNGLRQKLAVRSAFSAEDRPQESLAGFFKTILNVPHTDQAAVINALVDVWQSGELRDGDFRRDVLVMEMVDAQMAGVAFTQADYQDDLINATQGTGDKLVSGEVSGDSFTMPKLIGRESPTVTVGWQRRLQQLLRGIRRTFILKGHDWDIEWADDGNTCWLLQIRPITSPPRRNEAFTYANLKEILPDPPSPYMTSIVAGASEGFFDWYRQFDKTLPTSRPMVEIFYGRPLFNLSLLTDMMRHWGLPSALVTNSIGGSSEKDTGLKLGRFLRKTFVLLRLGRSQLNAVKSARQKEQLLIDRAENSAETFTALGHSFRDLFTLFVTEMFNLTQAMSGPLLLLRNSNAIAAASDDTGTTAMYEQFTKLRQLVAANPEIAAPLANGQLPNHAQFQNEWQHYLTNYGHRAIYESDISRPRYREQQTELLKSLAAASLVPPAPTGKGKGEGDGFFLLKPAIAQLRRVQTAREQWRHHSMRVYEILREKYLKIAQIAVDNGQLPTIESLWLLSMDEAAGLDNGAIFSAEFFQTRRAEIADYTAIPVPDFFRRFDNLEAAQAVNLPADVSQLSGVSLTAGKVSGTAWVLNEPALALPEGYDPATTILVARSVDAGWIPTFGLVAGVVVEIGGDLSHGSILLREIGIPAITNVIHATKTIPRKAQLTLNAAVGTVKIEANT